MTQMVYNARRCNNTFIKKALETINKVDTIATKHYNANLAKISGLGSRQSRDLPEWMVRKWSLGKPSRKIKQRRGKKLNISSPNNLN